MPGARSVGPTLAGWLIWAVVATAAGYALGIVELEALSIVRFLVIIAAIGISFEVFQSRIARWLEGRKQPSDEGQGR